MRIGYSFWGFLADVKLDDNHNEVSSPDGNATYGWSIIWEAQRRGHQVFAMQKDRDYPAYKSFHERAFSAFSQQKRLSAYENIMHTQGSSQMLPELDVLLIEWRFPINGRNCDVKENGDLDFDSFKHQPDLHRQVELLNHYKQTKTKIIVWDLDHKLTEQDEIMWQPDVVFETSSRPRRLHKDRVRIEPPTVVSDLLQWSPMFPDPNRKLVYVGSRYERDDVIDEWIKPVSDAFPYQVEFYGNWLKTVDDCRARWPNVKYCDRITTSGFRDAYGTAVGVPLLAKRSYLESGFITPRPWEAILFGTLPIGLASANGISQYVLDEFVAKDGLDMIDVVERMSKLSRAEKEKLREKNVEKLGFMDVKFFVDELEKAAK